MRNLAAAWAFCLLLAAPVHAADVHLAEQKIKAGMVYNFLKYTRWPAAAEGSPITVCLYGGDPFAGSLQPMQERSVNQRPIRLLALNDIAQVGICQLLVIDVAGKADWPHLRTQLAGQPVLTLSEMKGFTRQGGMIEFDYRNSRIRALLNLTVLTAASLQVEDRLLNLVTVVQNGEAQ